MILQEQIRLSQEPLPLYMDYDMNSKSCCGEENKAMESQIETLEEDNSQAELDFYLNKETNSSQRFAICKICPELKALNRCGKCGCFMNIKVRIYSAKCPIGKW